MARLNNQKAFLEKQIDLFAEPVNSTPVIESNSVSEQAQEVESVVVDSPVSVASEDFIIEQNSDISNALDKILDPKDVSVLDSNDKSESEENKIISSEALDPSITQMSLDSFQGTPYYEDRYVAISNVGLKSDGFTYESLEDFILSIPVEENVTHNELKEKFKDRTIYLQKLSNVDSSDETVYIEKNIKLYDRFLALRERSLQNDSNTKKENKREIDELAIILRKDDSIDDDFFDSSLETAPVALKTKKETSNKKKI